MVRRDAFRQSSQVAGGIVQNDSARDITAKEKWIIKPSEAGTISFLVEIA
jgi:hypothetical protein